MVAGPIWSSMAAESGSRFTLRRRSPRAAVTTGAARLHQHARETAARGEVSHIAVGDRRARQDVPAARPSPTTRRRARARLPNRAAAAVHQALRTALGSASGTGRRRRSIGTLTKRRRGRNRRQHVTSDKDMMQLVGPRVTLVDTMHDRRSASTRCGRVGVTPEQVIEVMALMATPSTTSPASRGSARRSAMRLISHYGSIDEDVLPPRRSRAWSPRREARAADPEELA